MDQLKAAPFLKWAGGKHKLLTQYQPYLPMNGQRYFEPFMGSAAIFFYMRAAGQFLEYRLSDSNSELVNTYLVVRDQVEDLIEALSIHQRQHSAEHYYAIRAMDRHTLSHYSEVERAARFIYLNKTGYNGLWRVNQRGQNNVPMGRYKNPSIFRPDQLRAASTALQGVDIAHRDFLDIETFAQPEDVIYFDPPYDPLSKTSNFTAYSADAFGDAQQRQLAELYGRLDKRGCFLLLSNSDTAFIRELYQGFTIKEIQARRMINTKADKRGLISELLILNR